MNILFNIPGRVPKFKEHMLIALNDQLISEGLIATYDEDQLEPKYPMIVTDYLRKKGIQELFHITTKDNAKFIEADGLLPRPPESGIDHPNNRIYLICQETPNQDILIPSLVDNLMRARGLSPEDAVIFSVPFEPDREYYIDETATLVTKGLFAIFTFQGINKDKIHRLDGFGLHNY